MWRVLRLFWELSDQIIFIQAAFVLVEGILIAAEWFEYLCMTFFPDWVILKRLHRNLVIIFGHLICLVFFFNHRNFYLLFWLTTFSRALHLLKLDKRSLDWNQMPKSQFMLETLFQFLWWTYLNLGTERFHFFALLILHATTLPSTTWFNLLDRAALALNLLFHLVHVLAWEFSHDQSWGEVKMVSPGGRVIITFTPMICSMREIRRTNLLCLLRFFLWLLIILRLN